MRPHEQMETHIDYLPNKTVEYHSANEQKESYIWNFQQVDELLKNYYIKNKQWPKEIRTSLDLYLSYPTSLRDGGANIGHISNYTYRGIPLKIID